MTKKMGKVTRNFSW